jgi:hypothetical protein
MILVLFIAYIALWLVGAYVVLLFVPPLLDHHNRVRAALAIAVVAVLFAGDVLVAKFIVSPVAISTFVSRYQAGEVPDPFVGKQWCDDLTVLAVYPAKICTFRAKTDVTSYSLYHSETLLWRPLDSFPGWAVVPEAHIARNDKGMLCLSIRDHASDCEVIQ